MNRRVPRSASSDGSPENAPRSPTIPGSVQSLAALLSIVSVVLYFTFSFGIHNYLHWMLEVLRRLSAS